jgi:NADH-quinone oxidoreductase subunit H
MAEYGSMFVVSGLAAILFFGGWHGPIPIFQGWAYQPTETDWRLAGYIANLAGCLNFILKAVIGVTVMMWVRWTLPRLRIDQVIAMCWKYCVPIAAVCFVGTLVWQTWGLPTPRTRSKAAVREGWVLAVSAAESVAGPDTAAVGLHAASATDSQRLAGGDR